MSTTSGSMCVAYLPFLVATVCLLAVPGADAGTQWSTFYEGLANEFDSQAVALRETPGDADSSASSDQCSTTARSLAAGKENAFQRRRQLQIMEHCLLQQRSTGMRFADSVEAMSVVNADNEAKLKTLELDKKKNDADVKFQGLSWGAGFGISHGFDDIITEAEVVDGVVRSTSDETQRARLVLETHRFFGCRGKDKQNVRRGCGPFGVVTTGSEDVLAGVGFGFMYGWKSPNEEKGTGFSVGLGALLDNEVRALADGFEDGDPLPDGETELRFESKARWSALLFFTRTF